MYRIAFFVVAALAATALAAEPKPNTLTEAELVDGWVLLFDGATLFGWKDPGNADWQVADGAIMASQGEKGLLCTTSQFGEYALTFDFRIAEGGDSGLFLHTIAKPVRADLTTKCYEVNISGEANAEWPSGSIVDRQPPKLQSYRPEWQTLEVTLKNGRLLVKVDGQTTADYTDPKPLGRGPIGLQFRTGKVQFRNIKLRPLGTTSIFNGKDLSGWTPYPGMAAIFSVTPEGWLHVRNGKGQLTSTGSYGDFTLQLEVFVNGPQLNSGIFFRAIPIEFWAGYESQIHNGYKNDDRSKPVDYGTGGIYNYQKARRVVPDDFAWFHKTIIADGRHMAVWVNGYQVSDWTDDRRADRNPRQGFCQEAGAIAIQAHDPTTDLKFRNLRIAELPPR